MTKHIRPLTAFKKLNPEIYSDIFDSIPNDLSVKGKENEFYFLYACVYSGIKTKNVILDPAQISIIEGYKNKNNPTEKELEELEDQVKKKKEDILPKEEPIIEKEPPKKEKKKRKPLSEEHKAKLAVSRAKALEVRRAKAIERKKMKELELEEKELLKQQKVKKFQKLKEEVTGEAPLAPKEEKRVGPLAQPPDGGFVSKKDLEQAQLDAIMKYEAIRKARKEEKKKTALVEAEKQKMLNTINRAIGGQYYKYRDGSNIWDRCY